MAAVSQGLREFANHRRPEAAPGIEVFEKGRCVIQLMPDFPVPGPNGVDFVRCRADEAGEVIDEVHAIVAPRHLPLMWKLDPETEPANFADHLAARGIMPDPRAPRCDVMVLPIDAEVEAPRIDGLEFRDALTDLETFRMADAVAS